MTEKRSYSETLLYDSNLAIFSLLHRMELLTTMCYKNSFKTYHDVVLKLYSVSAIAVTRC